MADAASKHGHDGVVRAEISTQDAKRAKADNEDGQKDGKESECENILSGFQTSNVLSDSAREKNIFILGKVADQDAVVILEKTPIREDTLAELFSGSTLRLEMRNDIYSTYRLQAPPQLNGTLAEMFTVVGKAHDSITRVEG